MFAIIGGKCVKPQSTFAGSFFVWREERERKERKQNRGKEKKGGYEGRKQEMKAKRVERRGK